MMLDGAYLAAGVDVCYDRGLENVKGLVMTRRLCGSARPFETLYRWERQIHMLKIDGLMRAKRAVARPKYLRVLPKLEFIRKAERTINPLVESAP